MNTTSNVITQFTDAQVRSTLGIVAVTTVTDPHPAVILHIARRGFVGQIIIVTRPDSIGMSAIQFQRWPLRQVAWDVVVPEGVAMPDVILGFFAAVRMHSPAAREAAGVKCVLRE